MDKPKRFIECLLPVSVCNLKCDYCYVIQGGRRNMKMADLHYTPEQIAYALRPERLGGICLINICGSGETLAQKELPDIVACLLKSGHYINITTNGTFSFRFDELIQKCGKYISHLHIAFSFHYLELKKRNLLDVFFGNIRKMREAGASFVLQVNLYDEYIPVLDEIKDLSVKNTGALPQLALTRNELSFPIKIHSKLSPTEYKKAGVSCCSPLFEFTCKNFNVVRKEFCYAGDWSFLLNLGTGVMRKCYENNEGQQNIFENPDAPIQFEAIGRNCKHTYCINSSHFMSLGVIPSVKTPTYAQLRNRETANWYTEEMAAFLNHKLEESNKKYSFGYHCSRCFSNSAFKSLFHLRTYKDCIKNGIRRILPLREKKYDWALEQLFSKLDEQEKQIKNSSQNMEKVHQKVNRENRSFAAFSETSPRFVFMGSPTYGNTGDHALAEAQKRIINSICPEKPYIDIPDEDYFDVLPDQMHLIRQNDVLLLPGGGNLGNEYTPLEDIRRSVILNFPMNRIIVLPQTCYFTGDPVGNEEKMKTVQIYNDHKDQHLFAREKISFKIMQKLFPQNDVRLVPDMALYPEILCKRSECFRSNTVLCCFRSDRETVLTSLERTQIRNILQQHLQICEMDTDGQNHIGIPERVTAVFEKMNKFRQAKFAITDRLHGMIFSIITGTPCIVFGNYNHKLKSVFSSWLSGRPDVVFLDSADQFQQIAEAWMQKTPVCGPLLDVNLYQPLTDLLKE